LADKNEKYFTLSEKKLIPTPVRPLDAFFCCKKGTHILRQSVHVKARGAKFRLVRGITILLHAALIASV